MKSIGIDLSLTHTGVAVLNGEQLLYSGSIKTKPKGDLPKDEVVRLRSIVTQIQDILDEHPDVDVVVLEGLAFMARNTTALVQLAGLSYLVRDLLVSRNIPFLIVAPTTLKKFITGKGIGDKSIMILETYKRYGHTFLDDNECDAFGLAKVGVTTGDDIKDLTKPQQEVITLIRNQI